MVLCFVTVLLIGSFLCRIAGSEDGVCTGIETKDVPTSHVVTYDEIEPYLGKCPGYFFRKCIMERYRVRSRIEYSLVPQTQVVRKCCHGFSEVHGVCTPTCLDGCVYSNCTAPNECTCYEGYTHDTPNKCIPKCDGCEQGTCIHPQVCFCNEGYDWDVTRSECSPRCYSKCENGRCTAPNHCTCNEGYTFDRISQLCVPHCDPPCVFGSCGATNQCKCDFEYIFKNGSLTECEPICEMSCLNAKCIEPNVCECNDGFISHDKEKPHECHCGKFCVHIEDKCVCLEESQRVKGHKLYENETISSECNSGNCVNGYCSDIDAKCECFVGYLKFDDFTCVANDTCIEQTDDGSCSRVDNSEPSRSTIICECINGICLSNNTCSCIGNYQISPKNSNKCIPVCDRECVNGICSEPNLCECNNYEEYRNALNETDWNICFPICDPDIEDGGGCINGTCAQPGICQCHKGFELSLESNFTCNPATYSSDFITKEKGNNGVIIWGATLFFIICVASASIVGYMVYKKRTAWRRPTNDDNYSSEPISFDCGEDL